MNFILPGNVPEPKFKRTKRFALCLRVEVLDDLGEPKTVYRNAVVTSLKFGTPEFNGVRSQTATEYRVDPEQVCITWAMELED